MVSNVRMSWWLETPFLDEHMRKIACKLICQSPGPHIQQIYTGLSMLHRSGLIDLTQEFMVHQPGRLEVAQHLRNAGAAHATVVLNNATTLRYDMHDAHEIDVRDLDTCDHYFKRSFSRSYVSGLPRGAKKVLPFGLNYQVLSDFVDWFAARRALNLPGGAQGRIFSLQQALDAGNWRRFYPRVRELESLPDHTLAPRVLFLVTAHDPHDDPDRSQAKVEERRHANETRAQCIRLLRKEMGTMFLGGFNHSEYAKREYKDCLTADAGVTDKERYIRTLKSHSICVATTGLHGSIGWKFAEYIACSKAILSERLTYAVPGDLKPGQNFLEFGSAAECVELAHRLIANRDQRNEMMTSNSDYYRAHLRPDVLLLNSLRTALSKAAQ